MPKVRRFSAFFSLFILALCACKAQTPSANPLTVIRAPQGGKIVYGPVKGAASQAAAMSNFLNLVQSSCGEKPQIGRVFQFRGTNSVGVFFVVTDHPEGNLPLAGLVIASAAGPNQMEGAMLYNKASQFSATVNPMLQQLLSVWHPGTGEPSKASPSRTASASASGPAVALHKVVLPDETASASIPPGWRVDPKSGGGGIVLRGSQGEVVVLNSWFLAVDPNGFASRNRQRMGMRPLPGMIVYPANADLVKNFEAIIQLLSRSKGFVPAGVKIDYAEQVSPPEGSSFEGERCALATGHIDPDGKGLQAMFRVICANRADQYGDYHFADYVAYFPHTGTSEANAIASAIFSSFYVNEALVAQRASAEAAPHIAQLKQMDADQRRAAQARTAQIIGNINQIGANATARMNSVEAANDAQHAAWNAGQVNNSRNVQGFSNYLLDQTVVEDNNMHGNGTVGHGTLWNSTADALVKADPNRFSYVNVPNYWQGTDFQP